MTKEELFGKLPTIRKSDKILLLTHIDMDGTGAPILLNALGFKNVTTIHCSNNTMSDTIYKSTTGKYSGDYDYILAVDISLNEEDAKDIARHRNKGKLVVFDHHKTSTHLNKYSFGVVESSMVDDSFRTRYYEKGQGSTSGTALFYDYLEYIGMMDNVPTEKKEAIEEFVQLVSGFDTWDWHDILGEDKRYSNLDKVEEIYGVELFEEVMSKKLNEGSPLIGETEEMLLKMEQRKIDTYLKGARKYYKTGEVSLHGETYSICFFTGGSYPTEVFEDMKIEHPQMDLYLINFGTSISLRSEKPEINAGEIAKALSKNGNGGGHPGAGGFKIPEEDQIEYISKALGSEIDMESEITYSF